MNQAATIKQIEAARMVIACGGRYSFAHYMHHWRDTESLLINKGYLYNEKKHRWIKQDDPTIQAA